MNVSLENTPVCCNQAQQQACYTGESYPPPLVATLNCTIGDISVVQSLTFRIVVQRANFLGYCDLCYNKRGCTKLVQYRLSKGYATNAVN